MKAKHKARKDAKMAKLKEKANTPPKKRGPKKGSKRGPKKGSERGPTKRKGSKEYDPPTRGPKKKGSKD